MMTNLQDVHHADLTPYVVRILQRHQIQTVVDFVTAPTARLAKTANLCTNTVDEMKQHLIDRYGPTSQNCLSFKDRALSQTFLLQTGIKSLDDLLAPGIISGSVVELCGGVTTGKSMLLTTIAIHAARQHKFQTLFIGTKRSFSGFRIYALLKALGCNQSECGDVMNRIRTEEVSEAVELVKLLRRLIKNVESDPEKENLDYQLLIVDSFAPLLFPYSGSHMKNGLMLLTDAMTLIRELAERQQIIVFVKALVLGDQLANATSKAIPVISTVSRYWPTVPSIRLYLEQERWNQDKEVHLRHIRILKSNQCSTGRRCSISLTTRGMVS